MIDYYYYFLHRWWWCTIITVFSRSFTHIHTYAHTQFEVANASNKCDGVWNSNFFWTKTAKMQICGGNKIKRNKKPNTNFSPKCASIIFCHNHFIFRFPILYCHCHCHYGCCYYTRSLMNSFFPIFSTFSLKNLLFKCVKPVSVQATTHTQLIKLYVTISLLDKSKMLGKRIGHFCLFFFFV